MAGCSSEVAGLSAEGVEEEASVVCSAGAAEVAVAEEESLVKKVGQTVSSLFGIPWSPPTQQNTNPSAPAASHVFVFSVLCVLFCVFVVVFVVVVVAAVFVAKSVCVCMYVYIYK